MHERSLLGVVLDSNYGSSWGGWCSIEVFGSYGVSGKILGVGGSFLVIPDLRWAMTL